MSAPGVVRASGVRLFTGLSSDLRGLDSDIELMRIAPENLESKGETKEESKSEEKQRDRFTAVQIPRLATRVRPQTDRDIQNSENALSITLNAFDVSVERIKHFAEEDQTRPIQVILAKKWTCPHIVVCLPITAIIGFIFGQIIKNIIP